MNNNIDVTKLNQPEEKNLPLFAVVDADILSDPDLSNAEFRALSIILSFSGKQGFCNVSAESLKEIYTFWGERNFRKLCQSLEEKKFLYRIQHPLHRRGSMRYLVPRQHAQKFISYILKKYRSAKYAAEVKTFFDGGDVDAWEKAYKTSIHSVSIKAKNSPKKQVSIPNGTKSATPAERHKKCHSINNINIINIEADSVEENPTCGKPASQQNPNVKATPPPFFKEKEKLKKELAKSKLDVHKGIQLFDSDPEYWIQKESFIGAIIHALREGYANERIRRDQERRAAEQRGRDAAKQKADSKEMGKAISEHFCREAERHTWRVSYDDYHCQVSTLKGVINFAFDAKGIESMRRFAALHKVLLSKN